MAPDLGLDLKLSTARIITNFSKEASSIEDDGKRIAKLEEYVTRLEEERRKIEVFKRELPLCMFLLNDRNKKSFCFPFFFFLFRLKVFILLVACD